MSEQSSSSLQESSLLHTDDWHEYETQFLGFTPKSFVDGVYNAILEYLHDGIELLEKYLLSEFDNEGVSAETVREGSEMLLSHFRNRFDKACDRLEKYLMKNIFHIPSRTILPSDKINQGYLYSEEEERKIDTEIQELQTKIMNMKYVNAYLKQYILAMDRVQGQLDAVLIKVETVENQQAGVSDMKESILFIAGKVHNIQYQLNSIYSSQLQQSQCFSEDGNDENKKLTFC